MDFARTELVVEDKTYGTAPGAPIGIVRTQVSLLGDGWKVATSADRSLVVEHIDEGCFTVRVPMLIDKVTIKEVTSSREA